jgi:hypothetical protein
LGKPEDPPGSEGGERERESPFADLDADAGEKFKGGMKFRASVRIDWIFYGCAGAAPQKKCPVGRGNPPGNEFRLGGAGKSAQGVKAENGKGSHRSQD